MALYIWTRQVILTATPVVLTPEPLAGWIAVLSPGGFLLLVRPQHDEFLRGK